MTARHWLQRAGQGTTGSVSNQSEPRHGEATEDFVDPGLALGPLLRHVDDTSAVLWLETSVAGEVVVRSADRSWRATTFTAHGHHYALVDVVDLRPGESLPYTVEIDGAQVWPPAGSTHPPSRIRTLDYTRPLTVAYG